ncbi:hypothetical protein CHS0354_031674 [Potamilus streckersoni]|uniref:Amine oxidase n=1 Tax=Potamilus streckersoni TaxID=2493646 RepID=A0AAE0W1E8_9BIVA|nr:hypothetical protein CHS0354_031674 [Potamilus streckersoni]
MADDQVDDQVVVIVVGAGISGLSAAKLLKESGLKVLVLEARDRVGGRTYTVKDNNHGPVDVGGAYVGPTQNRVFRLAKEFGLQFYDVSEKEKTVLNVQGTWAKYIGTIPPFWNPIKLLDLNHVIRTIDRMAKEVPCDAPWKAKKADEWDSMTVKQFIDSIVWTRTVKELMRIFIASVMCVEIHEVSLLFALWYINSGGGITRLSSITNGTQEKKFYGGSQQLSEKMAAKLGPIVLLSKPVIRIEQDEDTVRVIDNQGSVYKCRYVISAVPQALLNKIQFEPPLPCQKLQLIQRIPMGSIIKTIMFYREPFWKKLDLCGSAVSDTGIVSYCIDDTKPDGSHPAIMGFILADKAREVIHMTKEERRQAVCEHYRNVFKSTKFLQPVGYVEHNWMSEEYSGGCYVSTMPPGAMTRYGRYLRDPFGMIRFAGTESATYRAGYMEGAIESGERAAREILFEIGKVSKHQIYQDEPESPDYPASSLETSMIEWLLPSVTRLIQFTMGVVLGLLGNEILGWLTGWRRGRFN